LEETREGFRFNAHAAARSIRSGNPLKIRLFFFTMVSLTKRLSLLLIAGASYGASAFIHPHSHLSVSSRTFFPALRLTDDNEEDDQQGEGEGPARTLASSRWDSLNPKIKARIIKAGEERAIANKKKREPLQTKKRSECITKEAA
jgi:hypothetical protein